LPTSDLPNAYPYLPDIPGLQSGSVGAAASVLPAASALAGDMSGQPNLSALLADLSTYTTTELSALFGSNTAADVTSALSADLLSSLTGLFANPADFLSF